MQEAPTTMGNGAVPTETSSGRQRLAAPGADECRFRSQAATCDAPPVTVPSVRSTMATPFATETLVGHLSRPLMLASSRGEAPRLQAEARTSGADLASNANSRDK